MPAAFFGQFTLCVATAGRIVILFGSLLAFIRRLHGLFAVRAREARIVRFVVAGPFAMRLLVVRTGLVCGFVISHSRYQSTYRIGL